MSNSTPIQIPLTKGYFATIDDVDADLLEMKWQAWIPREGYCYAVHMTRSGSKSIAVRMHRIIMSRILNRELTKLEIIDHADGDGLNNSRTNLRLASRSENLANSKLSKRNKAGLKGATFNKQRNRWRANIRVNNRVIWLGHFDTPEEAHQAYCEAAVKYFGEFARFE